MLYGIHRYTLKWYIFPVTQETIYSFTPGQDGGKIVDAKFKGNFVNENWLILLFFFI